jgi:hypothetical protein
MEHFKQENGYGCGLYSLANLLRKESVITPERLEASKTGNHSGQLNKWLIEDGYELFLEPLYFSSTAMRLPKKICELKPHGEGVLSLPVFLDVQYSENSRMHFVAADLTTDGKLLVRDSLRDEIEETTLEDYQRKFYRVFGLWHLRHYTEEGYYMRMES